MTAKQHKRYDQFSSSKSKYRTLSYLASKGIVKPTKQVALYQVKTYTQTLDDANKNGSYDEVYTALLANRIDDYPTR